MAYLFAITEPLCEQDTGVCLYGCNKGFYQPDCSDDCRLPCVTGTCDRDRGICLECEKENPGWLCFDGGKYCSLSCVTTCLVQVTDMLFSVHFFLLKTYCCDKEAEPHML